MNNFILKLAALTTKKALVFGAVATGVWYFMLYDNGAEIEGRIANTAAELVKERAKEVESDAALKEIAAVQASIGALSDQFKLVSAQLPSDIQMAEIIRTVDKTSQAAGLSVKAKEPRPSTKQEVLEVLPLKVGAEGSFNEITMFMYYLSTIERIVRVQSFVINAPADFRKSTRLTFDADIASFKFLPADQLEENNSGGKR